MTNKKALESFEKLLKDYFKLPYRPEYLVLKVREQLKDYKFNHEVEIQTGVLKQECEEILKNFFKELRNKKEENCK